MFLSDGQAAIDDGLLQQLTQSGVRLRSFGIGADASCAALREPVQDGRGHR